VGKPKKNQYIATPTYEAEDADFIGEVVAKQYLAMDGRELIAIIQVPEDLADQERVGHALIAFGNTWVNRTTTEEPEKDYDA
jgi:hypothetical protein